MKRAFALDACGALRWQAEVSDWLVASGYVPQVMVARGHLLLVGIGSWGYPTLIDENGNLFYVGGQHSTGSSKMSFDLLGRFAADGSQEWISKLPESVLGGPILDDAGQVIFDQRRDTHAWHAAAASHVRAVADDAGRSRSASRALRNLSPHSRTSAATTVTGIGPRSRGFRVPMRHTAGRPGQARCLPRRDFRATRCRALRDRRDGARGASPRRAAARSSRSQRMHRDVICALDRVTGLAANRRAVGGVICQSVG